MSIEKKKKNTGFTLLETLVAISILLLSISAPLTIASRGLAASFVARDQITAFYLAQDAVEFIRNTRDNDFLSDVNWLNGLPYVEEQLFTIDTIDGDMDLCQGGCVALNYDSSNGFYSYGSGDPSIFSRSVSIQTINANEIIVSVTISWSTKTFDRTFSVKENLLDWQ